MEIPNGIIAHHEGAYSFQEAGLVPFTFSSDTSFLRIVELGLVIGKGGRDIAQDNAGSHVAGYSACFRTPSTPLHLIEYLAKPWPST